MTELSHSDLVSTADEVLAALSETIVQVDDDYRVRSLNRPESPVFRRAAATGDLLEEVMDVEAARAIKGLIENARRTGGAIGEYRSETDLFRVTAKPLVSAPLTLLVFQNISGLRHAGQTLVDLSRYRSDFLASVNDELRTPLTEVTGYAKLLSEPESALDERERAAIVRDMTDRAWDLAGIVEDLLAVARAEVGDLRVASVPVNAIANVAQVIESMGVRGSRVSVNGDRAITGVGDPARFRQVVRNLLSNALFHGSEPVTVEVAATGTHVSVQVKDRGAGLPEDLAESLFGADATGGYEGTAQRFGVGLWISREVTGMMGGELTYRREDDKTVLQVTIPLLRPT